MASLASLDIMSVKPVILLAITLHLQVARTGNRLDFLEYARPEFN